MPRAPELAPESGTVRGALLRAALAAALIVILLFYVTGEEQMAEAPLAPSPPVAELQPPPEPVEPPPLPMLLPEPPQAEEPTPPPVVAAEPAPEPAPQVEARAAPEASPPEAEVAAPPAAVAKPRPEPAPATTPHMVRLSGFGPLPAARNLLDAAATAGQPGRILHRVLIGPFASRDAARKAVSADQSGIVTEDGGRWWIQAGVYSDAENADRQRAALSLAGKQVVVHGMAEIGPFASRAAADKALAELRAALGQPLPDANVIAGR